MVLLMSRGGLCGNGACQCRQICLSVSLSCCKNGEPCCCPESKGAVDHEWREGRGLLSGVVRQMAGLLFVHVGCERERKLILFALLTTQMGVAPVLEMEAPPQGDFVWLRRQGGVRLRGPRTRVNTGPRLSPRWFACIVHVACSYVCDMADFTGRFMPGMRPIPREFRELNK